MFDYNKDIEAILQPRVDEKLLEGYFGGVFNPEKDKFYAATLVDISIIDYDEFEYLHEHHMDGKSLSHYDDELAQIHNADNSWQYKPTGDCIAEGIYTHFAITFWGVYYLRQWYILKSLRFYGTLIDVSGIKADIASVTYLDNIWEQSLFEPDQPLKLSNDEVIPVSVGMAEFKDAPWIVAYLKHRKKESINILWCRYFNEEIINPFFERLRISDPAKYLSFAKLRTNFTMIFPEIKQHIIFCCMAEDASKKWRLLYFLFTYETRKFYNWTYFQPTDTDDSYYYGDIIIDDLKQISHWDNENYLDSSCTMDDDNFWNNYVFAQKDGKYLYLQEI
jgi:hypothetical protein